MSGINKVFLIGRVKQLPEMPPDGNGNQICFLLSTTELIRKGQNYTEHIEDHRILLSQRQADIIVRLLEKNSPFHIEGKLKTRSSIRNNITSYITEIEVHHFKLIGRDSDFRP